MSMLGGLEHLSMKRTRVADVSALGGLRHLDAEGSSIGDHEPLFETKPRFEFFNIMGTIVDDLSMLGDVEELHVSGDMIDDVSTVGGLKRLVMSRCMQIIDYSFLGNIDALILSGCNVEDSDLFDFKGVRLLSLIDCTDIESIKGLAGGAVEELTLCGTDVTSIEPLVHCRNLRYLNVEDTNVIMYTERAIQHVSVVVGNVLMRPVPEEYLSLFG